MTQMDAVLAALPCELDDAWLISFEVDYEHGSARLALEVWLKDSSLADARTGKATIRLYELLYFVVQPPANVDPEPGLLAIQGLTRRPPNFGMPLPTLPVGSFEYFIFVEAWNSYIAFAAKRAELGPVEVLDIDEDGLPIEPPIGSTDRSDSGVGNSDEPR